MTAARSLHRRPTLRLTKPELVAIAEVAEAEAARFESRIMLAKACAECGARSGELHALECERLSDEEEVTR